MASDTQPSEGLCYVTATPKPSSNLSDAQFNDFYDNEHIPDILHHNFSRVALRYKNSNPASPNQYLALYPVEDVAKVGSPETAQMMEDLRFSKVLGGLDHHDLIEYGISAWRKIQTFEGQPQTSNSKPSRGKILVAVAIEPAAGPEAEADLDAWYRKQHLDMLSMCRGYRRSTRYRREGGEGKGPRWLALHEYVCEPGELPVEEIQRVRETEWSRGVLGNAKVFEREVWGLVGVQGEEGLDL